MRWRRAASFFCSAPRSQPTPTPTTTARRSTATCSISAQRFNATLVSGTSLTVSAECNAEGEVQGEVQHVRRSNSFDISGEVVWNTETEAFTWDATTDDNNDITVKCTAVRGYSISASDVTLQLTCTGTSTDGSVKSVNADLPLNDNLIAGILGYIERR